MTGEAERITNGAGESDVVTTASWREKPKEEQMELENPMWWPLHHDGRGRKRNKWSWRIRCGDHCIMTGEAERRTNGAGESDVVTTASWRERPKEEQNNVDGESDVVTTASWRERPKEEQMELENPIVVTTASWRERPKEEQMELENPMWWPLHHDGRGRKKNKIM